MYFRVGVMDEEEREDDEDDSAEPDGGEEAVEVEVKDVGGIELVEGTGGDTIVEEETPEEV